jgi:hypothetical protein
MSALAEHGKPLVWTGEAGTDFTVPGVESSPSGLMAIDEKDSMSEIYQSLFHSKLGLPVSCSVRAQGCGGKQFSDRRAVIWDRFSNRRNVRFWKGI